jgi:hypothetical protein
MAVNINIPKPVIDYNDLDNKPTLLTEHSELILDDGTNPHGTTASDVGAVPYSGATGNVDLGEFGVDAGFIEFDITPTNTPTTQGTLSWDVDDETLQLVMNGSIMKIGEDQYYPVKNQTGNNIPKGTAVRFAGTLGNSGRLLIAPYIADGSVSNSVFMGVTSEAIANGNDGKVMWFGRIRGINTNAFNDGDILYASPTVAGGFTTVANDKVQVCAVINKSINNGVIFVRPQIFPTTAEIGSVTDKRFVTDAQLTVLGNTSGTNTGDQDLSGLVPTSRNLTINGVTQDLSADRTFTIASGITVGTTSVTSGTDGRVFFQAGGVIQQDSAFFWDNTNKRLGVGATPNTAVRLDVRAQGALSTDIAFRVRNSADTANLLTQQGDGMLLVGSGTLDTNDVFFRIKQASTNYFRMTSDGGVAIGNGSALNTASATPGGIAIGLNSSSTTSGANSWGIAIGRSAISDASTCIAIGGSARAGQFGGSAIAIGSSAFASGSGALVIGNSSSSGNLSNNVVLIGNNVNIGATNYNRIYSLGAFISNGSSALNNIITLGGGTGTGANLATSTIGDSFNVFLGATERSFFVNKNSNVVLRSLQAITSGTQFEAAATNTFTIHNGTAPVANIADATAFYSADITAGNAAPHFRTENGNVIKLYQEAAVTTAQGIATALASQGLLATSTIVPTVQSVVTAATVTPAAGNEEVVITAQDGALTIANPTGTWYQGQDLIIRIKDDGTGRAITWGSDYRAIGVTLPTTTVANKLTYVGVIYNSTDSKWDVLGVSQEA